MGIDWEAMLGVEGDQLADAYDLIASNGIYDDEPVYYNNEREETRYERHYINCPYSEKDEAKSLGARWDPARKKWYFIGKEKSEKFKKWL